MEKKVSKNILLAVMGVLILAELAVTICSISNVSTSAICILASLIFVALYGFWLYKKPHGNMLKYALLVFAASNLLSSATFLHIGVGQYYAIILRLFASAAVCYCAGRLNRIEQNKYVLVIADIILFFTAITAIVGISGGDEDILMIFRSLTAPLTLLTLMIAYFVRFKEHKEAGLMDAPKK